MQIRLLEEPNVIYEVAKMLTDRADKRSLRDLKEELRSATRAEAQILDGCFDSIIAFCDAFSARLKFDDSVINHLFATRPEIGCPLASFILHIAYCGLKPEFPADAEKVRTESKAAFFANMYSLLLEKFPSLESEVKVESYAEFINFISMLPVSPELKWELCAFYNSFESVRTVVADIILEAGKIYLEEYRTVRHHTEWFTANYKMTAGAEPTKFVLDICPEAAGKTPDVLYIVPTVASAAASEYLMNYTSETVTDFVYAGVLCTPVKNITDKPFDEKGLCRSLRVLGDPSKFRILCLTSEGPIYGLQLAQELGISTATVSHHMSQLTEQELVIEEREANRVYYRANTEAVRRICEDLTRLFGV